MDFYKSMSKTFIVLGFVFLLNLTDQEFAWGKASGPVNIEAQIDNLKPTLGDIVNYSIKILHDPDIVLRMPEYKIPEGLEKIDSGNLIPIKKKQQITQKFWLKLRVDKTGPITFPSTPVWFDTPDQNKKIIPGKIMAPEINIVVQSLLKLEGNNPSLRDIKPIIKIKTPWTYYLWRGVLILCVLALIYYIWNKWKIKSDVKPEETLVLSAEEQAIKELKILEKRDWMKSGRVRDHFFELSEIFRRYLENRYLFPAQEWTSEEIVYHFKSFSDLSDNQKLKVRSILYDSDKIKFAKANMENCYDLIEPVTQFIKENIPSQVTTEQT